MPAPYITPNANDTAGIYEFFRFITTVTDGFFFAGIMVVIWVVTFIATKQFSTSRAFTYTSFICFILSMILVVIDLLAPKYMYLFIILAAAGAMWIKLEKDRGI